MQLLRSLHYWISQPFLLKFGLSFSLNLNRNEAQIQQLLGQQVMNSDQLL